MPTSLVTGANRGIGLELARQLRERGDHVIAACRKASPELQALDVQVEEGLDVSDDEAVATFAERLGDTKIDLLINNAGLLAMDGLEAPDIESIRRQFEVNAIGPVRVTSALLPRLQAGSKVALITSRMGSIADNSSGGMYGYRMSKAALNMAGMSMAQDLKKREVAVAILHPGMVATDMTARFGHGPQMQSPGDTAGMLIERIDGLELANSGTFWHAKGEELPW
jgi:NAD(P)-dependent dehydrogenase (short-subunit alcohol dehydrogenase family)